jgi:molecular chaperone GrpE
MAPDGGEIMTDDERVNPTETDDTTSAAIPMPAAGASYDTPPATTSEPPVSEPSASEPPASDPPVNEPPISEPTTPEPPVSEPPASEPPASTSTDEHVAAAAPSESTASSSEHTEHAGALAADLAALKDQLAQVLSDLEAERDHATDYMHKWQRAQADMSNFRRRVQQEEEQFAAMAAAQAMALVLPALDSFERAFKTLPESLQRLTWIEGIFLVESQLRRTLEAHGVSPFEPQPGDALDATRHQPVAQAETTAHPEGAVVEVVQRGYELNGRVLRPALVRIARAPADAAPSSGAGTTTSGSGPPPD